MDWTIKTVDISKLLGRHDIRWQLSPTVNILGGPNGSGKSTILRAIERVLTDKNLSGAPLDSSLKTIEITFTNDVRRRSGADNSKPIIPNEKKGVDNKNFSKGTITAEDATMPLISDLKVIYINSADQIASAASRKVSDSALADKEFLTYLDLLIEDELNNYNQQYTEYTQAVLLANTENKTAELLRIQELFDKFYISLQQFMPQYTIVNMSKLIFGISDEDGVDQTFPFTRLSTGEKQLVYLLLTVTNTLENQTLLLLDEADLGMHIDWKKILLRELRRINPNMQIIAATHSPSLIEGWYDNVRDISQLYV